MTELLANATEENLDKALKVLKNLIHKASEFYFYFYLFIKCMQPKVMATI